MEYTVSSFKVGAVALCAMAGCAFGATYTITNGSGHVAFGVGDSIADGFQGSEGVVAVGVFSSNAFATFTSSDFVTNFTTYGAVDSPFREPGIFGNNGTFEYTPGGSAANAPFANQPMLALIANAATFGAATEFLVLDLGRDFLPADDGVATPITVAITDSTSVLFGGTVANIVTFDNDVSPNQGFTTAVPVPEPSTLLLSAFGVLGLLRRKR